MKRFVFQNNLISENDLKQIQQVCLNNKIAFEEVTVIPFVNELPQFTYDEDNIYYGSTTFIYNLYQRFKPKGIFFDEDAFRISNYLQRYKEHMLSHGASVTTLQEFCQSNHDNDSMWFVRPDKDDKSFDGNVMSFKKIKNWQNNVLQFDETKLTNESCIIVSKPYNISAEYRCFVIDQKVITASQYRQDFRLKKSNIVPQEIVQFVEERCKEYVPSRAFVMDIGVSGGQPYIIECGCINSVGFYHSDIEKIIINLMNLF